MTYLLSILQNHSVLEKEKEGLILVKLNTIADIHLAMLEDKGFSLFFPCSPKKHNSTQ
tara:strand:+ start:77 stop:250 length:174 start_codon:yes stop_codon:yes gene_type:complete